MVGMIGCTWEEGTAMGMFDVGGGGECLWGSSGARWGMAGRGDVGLVPAAGATAMVQAAAVCFGTMV